jgi:hypothetical protein
MRGLAHDGNLLPMESPTKRSAMKHAPMHEPAPALVHNAIVLLQWLTSFIALKDPELMAAAAASVGADSFMPPFNEGATTEGCQEHNFPVPDPQPRGQQHNTHAAQNQELDDDAKSQLHEEELAKLHQEA